MSQLRHQHNRTGLYEGLYQRGYHSNLNLFHSAELITKQLLPYYKARQQGTRVLDLGCSHGKAVAYLWQLGFCAEGMDIAPTAVALARRTRTPSKELARRCGWAPSNGVGGAAGGLLCSPFHMGTSDRVPWPDGSFQAVLSSDVLEHVPTPLINATIGELTRLATDALFFKISIHHESSNFGTDRPLHETLKAGPWWQQLFEAAGAWSCKVLRPGSRSPAWSFWMVCKRRPP